ncbi:MAG: Acidobacterial duplicated orphan permease (function unknown), partial [uncultured Gemmatimonadaceae bacterium]
ALRPPLRLPLAPPQPGVRPRRRAHARAGHRRERHGVLVDGGVRAQPLPRGAAPRRAGGRAAGDRERGRRLDVVPAVRRPASRAARRGGAQRVPDVPVRRAGRGRRRARRARVGGVREQRLLRDARHPPARRPLLRRRGLGARHRARRRGEPRVLAAALRRGPERRGAPRAPERAPRHRGGRRAARVRRP